MLKSLAVSIDELGFRLILLTLGLSQRRHRPSADALSALREHGSPLEPPGLDAPPVPEVTFDPPGFDAPSRAALAAPAGGFAAALRPDARLWFDSPRPCDHVENNRVQIDLYCPSYDGTRSWGSGIVLGCPGVLTGAKGINEVPFRWWARTVARRGMTFGLVHPPYHMSRTPAGLISGELMFSGDLFVAAQGYVQAIADLKAATSWALSVTPRVAYWGASMGGVIGLLFVAREPRLSCCVPMIPAADMSEPLFNSTLCRVMRDDFVGAGGTAADLHALMEPLDPFHHPPAIARDRVLLVEAMYDRVCYPESLERLWAAWDCPPIMRYPDSHLSVFRSGACLHDMASYLQTFLTGPAALPAPAEEPVPVAA